MENIHSLCILIKFLAHFSIFYIPLYQDKSFLLKSIGKIGLISSVTQLMNEPHSKRGICICMFFLNAFFVRTPIKFLVISSLIDAEHKNYLEGSTKRQLP